MKAIVVDKNSADGLDYSIQKKIFEENGIEKPQTWDQLIDAAKAFQEKGIQAFKLSKNAKMQMRFWLFIDRLLQE